MKEWTEKKRLNRVFGENILIIVHGQRLMSIRFFFKFEHLYPNKIWKNSFMEKLVV